MSKELYKNIDYLLFLQLNSKHITEEVCFIHGVKFKVIFYLKLHVCQ